MSREMWVYRFGGIGAVLATVLATVLAGCSSPAPQDALANAGDANGAAVAAPTPTATAAVLPDLTGRWVGVEGMVLLVSALPAGAYALEMQYDLDHKQSVVGHATARGIAFERDGKTLTLRPTDGAATGLKYLADKRDCLTVATGEGYCRS